jgi:glutamine synthetase type III
MALDGKFVDLLVKGLSVVAGHNKNIGKVIDLLSNSLDKLQTTTEDSGKVGKAAKAARVLKDDVAEVKQVLRKAKEDLPAAAAPRRAAAPLKARIAILKLRL